MREREREGGREGGRDEEMESELLVHKHAATGIVAGVPDTPDSLSAFLCAQ